jgi:hypothetical protein
MSRRAKIGLTVWGILLAGLASYAVQYGQSWLRAVQTKVFGPNSLDVWIAAVILFAVPLYLVFAAEDRKLSDAEAAKQDARPKEVRRYYRKHPGERPPIFNHAGWIGVVLWGVLCLSLLLAAILIPSFDHNLAKTRDWAFATPLLAFLGGVGIALSMRMPAPKRRYYRDDLEQAPGARVVQAWREYREGQSYPRTTAASELGRLPYRAFTDARHARRDRVSTPSAETPASQTEDAGEADHS